MDSGNGVAIGHSGEFNIARQRVLEARNEDKPVSPEPLTHLLRRIQSRAFTRFKTGY